MWFSTSLVIPADHIVLSQVYRAALPDGTLLAVKRAQKESTQGAHEFKTEIEMLSRVHHRNLVSLIGFCFEQGEQMLVYEYIPNGNLKESLTGTRPSFRNYSLDSCRIHFRTCI